MSYVPLLEMKSTIKSDFYSLSISIPSKRDWFGIIFFSFWLIMWAWGEGFAIRSLIYEQTTLYDNQSLLVWLGFWSVAGISAFYNLLWMILGEEIIIIRSDSISIKKDVMFLGLTRKYDLSHIRNMRVSRVQDLSDDRVYLRVTKKKNPGLIAFDYGSRTIHFGRSIDELEAKMILKKTKEIYPSFFEK